MSLCMFPSYRVCRRCVRPAPRSLYNWRMVLDWAACAPLNTGPSPRGHRHPGTSGTWSPQMLSRSPVSGGRSTSGSHGNIDILIMADIRHRMQLSVFCVYCNFILLVKMPGYLISNSNISARLGAVFAVN